MREDQKALAILAGALLVAFVGILVLVTGSARRAELVVRGGEDLGEPSLRRVLEFIDLRLRRGRPGRRLHEWLRACGAPLATADFVGIVVAVAVVVALLGMLVVPPAAAGIIGVAGTLAGARSWGERLRGQRSEAFIQQLPELARTLSNASAAGLSMIGAVQLTARELADPAGTEMRAVVQELRLGRGLDDALEGLQKRLPSRESAVLVTTLTIQQRAGGDTVRALQELSETLDARKDLRREVRTLLAGTVYTAYLVAGIGFGTIFLLNVLSPGVLRQMFNSVIGLIALAVAGILWGIAFVLIRQTTRVDM